MTNIDELNLQYQKINNDFFGQKNIDLAAEKYQEQYNNLDQSLVRLITREVIRYIIISFSPSACEDETAKLYNIGALQSIIKKNFSAEQIKKLPLSLQPIYNFSKGNLDLIEKYFKAKNIDKNHASYQQYQALAQNVVMEEIHQITQKIKHELPIALQTDVEKYESHHHAENRAESELSFVERFAHHQG